MNVRFVEIRVEDDGSETITEETIKVSPPINNLRSGACVACPNWLMYDGTCKACPDNPDR